MRVYRICLRQFADTAFSGAGAAANGGRWNSLGTRMVYTGCAASLVQLEYLVHADRTMNPPDLVLMRAEVPDGLVERLDVGLADDWERHRDVTRAIGDDWIAEARSVALRVPSAVSPGEFNLLLNPLHPDFAQVSVGAAEPFVFDVRLFDS